MSGLTSDTTYHYRLVASNANGPNTGQDRTYTPHAVIGLTTEPATNITSTAARLNGSFVGNGQDTHYFFEWGTDTSYGHRTTPSPGVDAGSGSGFTAEFADLTELAPQTEYHYRIVARNAAGTSDGEDQSFVTLPAVAELKTEPATNVTPVSARLNGGFGGNGEDTHYYFEWGTASEGLVRRRPLRLASMRGRARAHRGCSPISANLSRRPAYDYRMVATEQRGIDSRRQPRVRDSTGDPESDRVGK